MEKSSLPIGKWLYRGGLGIALLLALGVAVLLAWHAWAQQQTRNHRPHIDPAVGVDELYTVEIGGIPQWIHVRGADRERPLLLFLHGGPGTPMMPFSHLFQDQWERHFVVVQWDQRGVGKTRYASDAEIVDATIDYERMQADAHELTAFLKRKYGKPKIFLVGHSWGSMLGTAVARQTPDDYYAYVGVGQVVEMQENERLGYQAALRIAERDGQREALQALRSLAPYPTADGSHLESKIDEVRKWQTALGIGISHRYRDDIEKNLLGFAFASPEYSLADLRYFLEGPSWPPLTELLNSFDIYRYPLRYELPMVFINGRHDWQTPSVLAESYFQAIQAPQKKLFWLEKSAHSPMVDEPDEFARILIQEVLPYAEAPASPR